MNSAPLTTGRLRALAAPAVNAALNFAARHLKVVAPAVVCSILLAVIVTGMIGKYIDMPRAGMLGLAVILISLGVALVATPFLLIDLDQRRHQLDR